MQRNQALDGIRGYSALSVLIFHAITIFDFSLGDHIFLNPIQAFSTKKDLFLKFLLTLINGQAAVTFFFILSGVVLFQSLKNISRQNFIITILEFTLKRIFRIYPALILCLFIFFVLCTVLHLLIPTTFIIFPFNYVMKNAFLYSITVNPPTWTLKVEILIIPFILVTYYFYKILGAIALFVFLGYAMLSLDNFWLTLNLFTNPALISFGFGFLIPTELGKHIFSYFKNKHCIVFLILAAVVRQILPFHSATGFISQAMFAAIFVGILFYYPYGPIYKFLTYKISIYLGKISYSFYLLNPFLLFFYHKMILMFFSKSVSHHVIPFGLLDGLLTLITTIPLAHLSQKYFEEPFVKIRFNFSQNFFTKRLLKTRPLMLENE